MFTYNFDTTLLLAHSLFLNEAQYCSSMYDVTTDSIFVALASPCSLGDRDFWSADRKVLMLSLPSLTFSVDDPFVFCGYYCVDIHRVVRLCSSLTFSTYYNMVFLALLPFLLLLFSCFFYYIFRSWTDTRRHWRGRIF